MAVPISLTRWQCRPSHTANSVYYSQLVNINEKCMAVHRLCGVNCSHGYDFILLIEAS